MPEDDPLNVTENVLRDLIKDVLQAEYGNTWEDHLGVTSDRRQDWDNRRREEAKRRTGGVADERSLYYANFPDLKTIITKEKNWLLFIECFGDKKTLEVYLRRLDDLRNPHAHSRSLLPFELDLINGMTGEIRQKVTIYRSRGGGGPEPEHFPRIDEIRDSYNNRASGYASSTSMSIIDSRLTLRPGDSVTFSGTATDPDNRPLRWVVSGSRGVVEHKQDGTILAWLWVVEERHIAEQFRLTFQLYSDRPYHRDSNHGDDWLVFAYRVLPPRPGVEPPPVS